MLIAEDYSPIIWIGPWCLCFLLVKSMAPDPWLVFNTGWDACVRLVLFLRGHECVLFLIFCHNNVLFYLLCCSIPPYCLSSATVSPLNHSWMQFTFCLMFLWMQVFAYLKGPCLYTFIIWDYYIQWKQRFKKKKKFMFTISAAQNLFLPARVLRIKFILNTALFLFFSLKFVHFPWSPA